jgi:hypothetical protein
MRRIAKSLTLASVMALATAGCANQTFRAAVAKFGVQTDAAMKTQSIELAQVVAGEQDRIQSTLAESRAALRFSGSCGLTAITTDESFAPCAIKRFVSERDGTVDVEKVVDVSSIIKLQDALANYGANLALLSQSASADNQKFAEAATGLAASVGKLDSAITKLAGSDRTVSDANLSTVAGAIAKIAGLAFALQREHALKEIIRNTDPFVQRAIGLLGQADKQVVQILAARATSNAEKLRKHYNDMAVGQASSSADRKTAIVAVFDSVDRLNLLTQRQSQIMPLGRIHEALALAATRGSSRQTLATAIEQLIRWNSNQGTAPQSLGDK